ncbi:MAG: phasin family protein [Pseudomonadota bacterium]
MVDTPKFEIPDNMREMASSSLAEARKALMSMLDNAAEATEKVEGSAMNLTEQARGMGREAMDFTQSSMAKTFDYAEKMLKAKDPSEIFALQQEYLTAQMEAMQGEAKKFADKMSSIASEAAKTK